MTHEYIKGVGIDYFLDNPPLQPKSEIADYVEACGILVPKRYVNLKEALASNKPFIIRSEHPQDYAGASGVLESIDIGKDKIEEAVKREKSEFEKDNYFYL